MLDFLNAPEYHVGEIFPHANQIQYEGQIKPIITYGMFDIMFVDTGIELIYLKQ